MRELDAPFFRGLSRELRLGRKRSRQADEGANRSTGEGRRERNRRRVACRESEAVVGEVVKGSQESSVVKES